MMKFVLVGYRYPKVSDTMLFPYPSNTVGLSHPVFDAVYISEDLIFGRE